MIWNDERLKDWIESGNVGPASLECVNPASLDLRLGNEWIDLSTRQQMMGTINLSPGMAILATTMEFVKLPNTAAGVLYLKSSLARQGLDHALAGWIDPGFKGQLTLELHAHRDIILTPGQRIVQIVLYQMMSPPITAYNGRYQYQIGPTLSR